MKTKSNRRGRRQRGYRGLLWVLAAGLLLFGLIAQQDILLSDQPEQQQAGCQHPKQSPISALASAAAV